MHFTSIALFLFAATHAVANPVNTAPENLAIRGDNDILITYEGTCYKDKNECKYKNQDGHTTYVKCPKFDNKKCTADGRKCEYDSVSKKVTCD